MCGCGKAHQIADVPVGHFLLAGIDSALLTAIATAHGERPADPEPSFCRDYSGTANDEALIAEQLAAVLGTGQPLYIAPIRWLAGVWRHAGW
ncbi:MAG: hypothetical protein IPF38_09530 [Burkholderiales bacterium]|nr:hypothetical protein [Burkholderiales bacterium]